MRIEDVEAAGREIISIIGDYTRQPHREMLIDPILYAYLRGRFTSIARQHHVSVYGSNRPRRIDFRKGGSNPVVLELAVRPPTGGGHLLGGQNASELRKLCKVSKTQARLRALLLIDLYGTHYLKADLKASFDLINAGPGKFTRSAVRVVYVHRNNTFNFAWNPFK